MSGVVGVPIVHKLRASTIRKAVDQVLSHIREEHGKLESHLKLGYINVRICLQRLDIAGLPGESLSGGYVRNAGRRRKRAAPMTNEKTDGKGLSARERVQARIQKL